MRLRLAVLATAALGLSIGCTPNVVGGSSSSSSTSGAGTTGSTGTAGSTATSASSTGGSGSSSTTTSDTGSSGSTGSTGSSGSSGGSTTGAPTPGDFPQPPYGVVLFRTLDNFSFNGYLTDSGAGRVDAVTQKASFDMQAIRSLVRPDGTSLYRYLLLDVSAGWCPPCNQEADDLGAHGTKAGKIAEWKAKGGLMITVLVQGYDENTGTLLPTDIDTWLNAHDTQNSLALDLQGGLLAAGVDTSAFPTNLVIDLRTMQIVKAWYGLDDSYQPWEDALNNP